MNINEYIEKFRDGERERVTITPKIKCNDGFKISVQASVAHYCRPDNNYGPHTHVECGYPSHECERLIEYAQRPEDLTGTVYPYVPIEVIEEVIRDHGGMVED